MYVLLVVLYAPSCRSSSLTTSFRILSKYDVHEDECKRIVSFVLCNVLYLKRTLAAHTLSVRKEYSAVMWILIDLIQKTRRLNLWQLKHLEGSRLGHSLTF